MGRVVAISGGGIRPFNLHSIQLSGKINPNVLSIPTAQMDAEKTVDAVTQEFEALGCKVKTLCLVNTAYSDEEIDNLLKWADIVYVAGGDTISMMKIWKENGLDIKLKKVYENDSAVLSGISAGAICWFACGHSDSESFHIKDGWNFVWAEGMLDIFHFAYCPHYNENGRNSFDAMLEEKKDLIGLALENYTAYVENNGKQYYLRSVPTAKAYKLQYINGILQKNEIDIIDINNV